MARDGFGTYSPPAGTLATSGTSIESAKYNAFVNDLTTDANTARPIVAGGTGATTASAALANLGGQPLDADLTAIAALTSAANKVPYATGAGTWAMADFTAAGRALLDDADAAAQRTTLGAQASNATLTSLAGLTLVAGDILYATGANTLVKLAAGTALQSLRMNSGATAPEWATVPRIVAWVKFNGTGTIAINSSFNVSSITDNGVGNYTINFSSALSSADYAVSGWVQQDVTGGFGYVLTANPSDTFSTTQLQVRVRRSDNGAAVDGQIVCVTVVL